MKRRFGILTFASGPFSEIVHRWREAGIEEFIFSWPPLASVRRKEPIPALQQATFERIAAERIAPLYRVGS